MVSQYRVRVVVSATGERLPLLLNAGDGSPLFLPNVFAVSQVRGASRAANSIETYLRSIVVLLTFAERAGIDIERRVRTGAFLTLGEMDRLAEAASYPVDQTPAPRKR